jgi:hypothetical protein
MKLHIEIDIDHNAFLHQDELVRCLTTIARAAEDTEGETDWNIAYDSKGNAVGVWQINQVMHNMVYLTEADRVVR